MIYATKVCDRCFRNTHHVDYPCCSYCAGYRQCVVCSKNWHPKRFRTCFGCKGK